MESRPSPKWSPSVPDLAPLYPISRRHLDALSGELGIMQHAIGAAPDPARGYCVDDVARALEVDLLHARVLGWPAVAESAWRNLRFLDAAFDPATGAFRNFRTITGEWVAGRASQDSQGRVMLAIGATIEGADHQAMREAAIVLWDLALPAAARLTAFRAQASVVLGCDARIGASANEPARILLAKFARGIDRKFRGNASSDWFSPENELTYENALLARCLIVAGRRLRSPDMVGTGVQAIDWLFRVQTTTSGHLSPIGNGWWTRSGVRSRFDQQPIEATALLLAAEAALDTTGDPRFRDLMELAYAWFLGRNDLGVSVAYPARGACSDGLTPGGVNTNEGAESTLMWLVAAEHMRTHRAATIGAAAPAAAPKRAFRSGLARPQPALIHLASVAR
jgi:hypothetical protein